MCNGGGAVSLCPLSSPLLKLLYSLAARPACEGTNPTRKHVTSVAFSPSSCSRWPQDASIGWHSFFSCSLSFELYFKRIDAWKRWMALVIALHALVVSPMQWSSLMASSKRPTTPVCFGQSTRWLQPNSPYTILYISTSIPKRSLSHPYSQLVILSFSTCTSQDKLDPLQIPHTVTHTVSTHRTTTPLHSTNGRSRAKNPQYKSVILLLLIQVTKAPPSISPVHPCHRPNSAKISVQDLPCTAQPASAASLTHTPTIRSNTNHQDDPT